MRKNRKVEIDSNLLYATSWEYKGVVEDITPDTKILYTHCYKMYCYFKRWSKDYHESNETLCDLLGVGMSKLKKIKSQLNRMGLVVTMQTGTHGYKTIVKPISSLKGELVSCYEDNKEDDIKYEDRLSPEELSVYLSNMSLSRRLRDQVARLEKDILTKWIPCKDGFIRKEEEFYKEGGFSWVGDLDNNDM